MTAPRMMSRDSMRAPDATPGAVLSRTGMAGDGRWAGGTGALIRNAHWIGVAPTLGVLGGPVKHGASRGRRGAVGGSVGAGNGERFLFTVDPRDRPFVSGSASRPPRARAERPPGRAAGAARGRSR